MGREWREGQKEERNIPGFPQVFCHTHKKMYNFKTTAPYIILQDNPPDIALFFVLFFSILRLLTEVQPGKATCTGRQTIWLRVLSRVQ